MGQHCFLKLLGLLIVVLSTVGLIRLHSELIVPNRAFVNLQNMPHYYDGTSLRSRASPVNTDEGLDQSEIAVLTKSTTCLRQPSNPHPYAGARDQYGCYGYRHHATALMKHKRSFTWEPSEGRGEHICDNEYGLGAEGIDGYQALKKTKLVYRDEDEDTNDRLLCIVYTHSGRHESHLRSITETWGRHCHGFLAASNQTDAALGAIHVVHAGPEEYGNMWQKVRSTWAYVYQEYRDDYTHFYMCGDDTLVIPENLMHSLQKYSSRPLYLGAAMTRTFDSVYCGGGAGYALNRAALVYLVEEKLDSCWNDHVASDEDRIVADCLSKVATCTHDVDDMDETTFHILYPKFHALWKKDIPVAWHPQDLLKYYNLTAPMKEGLDSISRHSISFHLVPPHKMKARNEIDIVPETIWKDGGMRRMYAIVYGLCHRSTTEYQATVYNLTESSQPRLFHSHKDLKSPRGRMYRNVIKLLLPEYKWGNLESDTAANLEVDKLDLFLCSWEMDCTSFARQWMDPIQTSSGVDLVLVWLSHGGVDDAMIETTNTIRVVELGPKQSSPSFQYFRLTELQILFCNTQRPQYVNALTKENQRPVASSLGPLNVILVSNPLSDNCLNLSLLANLSQVVPVHYYGDILCSGDESLSSTAGFVNLNETPANQKTSVDEQIVLLSQYRYCLVMQYGDQADDVSGAMLMAFYAGCLPIYYSNTLLHNQQLLHDELINPQALLHIRQEADLVRRVQYLLNNETLQSDIFKETILQDRAIPQYLSLVDWIGAGAAKKRIRNMLGLGRIEFVK